MVLVFTAAIAVPCLLGGGAGVSPGRAKDEVMLTNTTAMMTIRMA